VASAKSSSPDATTLTNSLKEVKTQTFAQFKAGKEWANANFFKKAFLAVTFGVGAFFACIKNGIMDIKNWTAGFFGIFGIKKGGSAATGGDSTKSVSSKETISIEPTESNPTEQKTTKPPENSMATRSKQEENDVLKDLGIKNKESLLEAAKKIDNWQNASKVIESINTGEFDRGKAFPDGLKPGDHGRDISDFFNNLSLKVRQEAAEDGSGFKGTGSGFKGTMSTYDVSWDSGDEGHKKKLNLENPLIQAR
jgi:hypothetical protein